MPKIKQSLCYYLVSSALLLADYTSNAFSPTRQTASSTLFPRSRNACNTANRKPFQQCTSLYVLPLFESLATNAAVDIASFDSAFSIAVPWTTEDIGTSTSSLLLSHHQTTQSVTNIPIIDTILASPTFWSISIMITIVGLLLTWENSVHTLRVKLPPVLTPVVDSMLGEIGGLGFIGLVLDIFATSNPDRGIGGIISSISEEFLGERELLLESFEALHKDFFEVGIAFFIVMGAVVYAVLTKINLLSDFSLLTLDKDGDGEVCLEELADSLGVESVLVDSNGDGVLSDDEISLAQQQTKNRGLLDEATLSIEERAAEILLIRRNFLDQHQLPNTFKIERYFDQIFAHNLKELVELLPLTWLPLIPLVSLLDTIDLSNDVVSGSSANVSLIAGCFVTTPSFTIPAALFQVIALFWGLTNYGKLETIKNMLVPVLVRDSSNGAATMLPARYKNDIVRRRLNTSSGLIAIIEESFGGEKYTNDHEYLFGAAGKAGPELYRISIKFHTWLCVAQIVIFLGQIVIPDLYTLLDYNTGMLSASDIGNLEWLVPEIVLYSGFVLLLVAQLILTPSAFLNYCTATSIEEMTQMWALEKAKKAS